MKTSNDKTKAILLVSEEAGKISVRYKGDSVFSAAGEGADAKTRQELVAALRETLTRMPPEEAAKVLDEGIAIDFAAPELEELIRLETAMKTRRI